MDKDKPLQSEYQQIDPKSSPGDICMKPSELLQESAASIMRIIPMNEYIDEVRKENIPSQLFGPLWYEGEVCYLFSRTGLGKSILAVQVGDSITKGIPILGFNAPTNGSAVAYLDIENFGKLIEYRYSDKYAAHYSFSGDFLRMEIDPGMISEDRSLEDQVLDSIEGISRKYKVKIFIIDNITALITDFEKSRNAVRLMKKLYALKKEAGLSFLVLGHIPKKDPTVEISADHLAGSKVLMNLCDSAIAIGSSITVESSRYIKQIKSRYGQIEFGNSKVIKCHIEKSQDNMLHFVFDDYTKEILFLTTYKDANKEARAEQVIKLKDEKGRTFQEIADELGMSKGNANKIYRKHKNGKS